MKVDSLAKSHDDITFTLLSVKEVKQKLLSLLKYYQSAVYACSSIAQGRTQQRFSCGITAHQHKEVNCCSMYALSKMWNVVLSACAVLVTWTIYTAARQLKRTQSLTGQDTSRSYIHTVRVPCWFSWFLLISDWYCFPQLTVVDSLKSEDAAFRIDEVGKAIAKLFVSCYSYHFMFSVDWGWDNWPLLCSNSGISFSKLHERGKIYLCFEHDAL